MLLTCTERLPSNLAMYMEILSEQRQSRIMNGVGIERQDLQRHVMNAKPTVNTYKLQLKVLAFIPIDLPGCKGPKR